MKSHFKENLALLRISDPELAERMEAHPWPVEGVTLFDARTGAPSVKGVSHDGVEIPLHSEYDPAREAKQFVDARQLKKSDAQLLNGLGLGHVALEIASRLEPNRWLVCVEAHEGLFRAALEGIELSTLFHRKNFRIFVGRDWPRFQTWIKELLMASNTMRLNIISYPPCHRFFPDFYNEVSKEVQVAINRQRVELATVITRGRDMDRNGIRNLPLVATAVPVRSLEGAFDGYPGIVVGAGPSLTTALPFLLSFRDRILIVSVDAALKPLLAYGITPDFVVSLDMGPTIMKFYTDLPPANEMTLVFDPDCWYEVPATYEGRRITYETANTMSRWSKRFMGELGEVDKGTSVAHTSFQLASKFGCDPLILVGLDLSYPGNQTHAEGVPVSSPLDPTRKKYIQIPGVQGKPVRSTEGFQSFVVVFEVMISRIRKRVIQSSEVGAFIRGAENLPLPVALERHATERRVVDKDRGGAPASHVAHFDYEAFQEEASATVSRMKVALEVAESGLRLVRQLKRLDPDNKLEMSEIRKKLVKAKNLERSIWTDSKVSLLFSRVLAEAAHELRSLHADLDELVTGDSARARNVTNQFEVIFSGYRDGAAFFLEEFLPVRDRMLKEFGAAGD